MAPLHRPTSSYPNEALKGKTPSEACGMSKAQTSGNSDSKRKQGESLNTISIFDIFMWSKYALNFELKLLVHKYVQHSEEIGDGL